MFSKHKWPTFEGITLIILMIISVFSFAFFTSGGITGFAAGNKVTGMASGGSEADETGEGIKIKGEMVRVKGMEKGEINVVV